MPTEDFNIQYTFQAYQAQAARTSMVRKDHWTRLNVSAMGLASEVGELLSEIKHSVEQDRDPNWEWLSEELGDCAWYLSDLCTIMGVSLAEVAHANIMKLERRHPNGFSAETSKARLDKLDAVKHE